MENKLSQSVSIHQKETYSRQILELLNETLWGTPGKTLYRHLDTPDIIDHISSPLFFSLHRFGNLLCTVCLSEREINVGRKTFKSKYVCYLAAAPSINGKGLRNKKEKEKNPNGMIKTFMNNVLLTEASDGRSTSEDQKSILYAYVESDNEQSLHLCHSFGFQSVRQLTTMAFSRFYPKDFPYVRKAKPTEYEKIRKLIAQQYSLHNFLCLDYIFYGENYYVIEADGKIVAGVQANPINWSFKNLPGLSGKVLLRLLPHIPYLKKLINPKHFKFSAFEGIYCEKGYEYYLDPLFETALNQQSRNTALIWLDINCPIQQMIRKHCSLGLMDKINSNGIGEIMVRADGLTNDYWTLLKERPMYISCFDMN
jgi:hypothetical protein